MSDPRIIPVVMPKWGLSMKEGTIASWLVPDGTTITAGTEILEVETDKIAGPVESQVPGVLRRVGAEGTTYPVKALIGIIADPAVPSADLDAFVAAYETPAGDDDGDGGAKYEYADTPAGRLRYAKRGEGAETVILLHGFGGDADNWLFNIDALAESATVYALDMPGHGQSTKTLADASLAGMTAALAGFMDTVGIASAHLVGHSMGGAIAMQMAGSDPGRVRSMTLICSAGMGPEFGSYVDTYVAATGRRDLKPALEMLFADKSLVSRQLIDDVLKYKRLDGVEAALTALATSLFGGGRQQDLPAAKLDGKTPPALVIWGEADEIIPVAHAGKLAGAKVHVLPGAGHMVFMEKAGDVNALIKAHIAGQ